MAEPIKKCPMCNTKLKMINGRMTCKECGYYVRSRDEAEDNGAFPSGSSAALQETGTARQQSPADTSSRKQDNGRRPTTARLSIGTIAAIITVSVVKPMIRNFPLFPSNGQQNTNSSYHQNNPTEKDILPRITPSPAGTPIPVPTVMPFPTSTPAPQPTELPMQYPESRFFRGLIEAVYGKGYDHVTQEEYAALTFLQIDEMENTVRYQRNRGETGALRFSADSMSSANYPDYTPGFLWADLSRFTGLEVLDVGRNDVFADSLEGLENLHTIHCSCSFSELEKAVPFPEKITELTVQCGESLNGIESFPNLRSLTLYNPPADLSALSAVSGLSELSLISYHEMDLSFLSALTGLKKLDICSPELKSIDFVLSLPNLTSLGISASEEFSGISTQLRDISALAHCTGLTSLSLEDNSLVTDYSAIEGLAGLTSLTLSLGKDTPLPSFRNLTKLEILSLTDATDLAPLKDAANVKILRLKYCGCGDLDFLAAMRGLTSLSIVGVDYRAPLKSLSPLKTLPGLSELSISNARIYGDITEVFGLSSLKCLRLDHCDAGVNLNAPPSNGSLEILSLRDSTFPNYPAPGADADGWFYLSEHTSFFDSFPNLRELYLRGQSLDTVSFAANLPKLRYLDISDADIADFTPLLGLDSLEAVWCSRGDFSGSLPENHNINIISLYSREWEPLP